MCRVGCGLPVLDTRNSSSYRPDPDCPVTVSMDDRNGARRCSLCFRIESREPSLMDCDMRDSVLLEADPHTSALTKTDPALLG